MPVGVFFQRVDVVRATIVQLIELKKISTEPTSSDGRVVLKLLLNQGKLIHPGKSEKVNIAYQHMPESNLTNFEKCSTL